MKGNEFGQFMRGYLNNTYGVGSNWEIEISTKRDKKVTTYGTPGYFAKYTMYIFDQSRMVAKSSELEGYHKSQWSGQEYADFIHTLKAV